MSDGALRISILGDASQFKETLGDLRKSLEKFKEDLKTATGLDIPRLNLEIFGAETSIKQITEFGKFAQGSLGFYQQLKKELEGQLLVTTNRAEQEDLNKRLVNTLSIIKEIKSAGIEKPIPIPIVIEPPPPGSIASLRETIKNLTSQRDIQVDRSAFEQYNTLIQQLENKIKELKSIGIEIPVKPIPPVLENSIQGIKNQIDELNRKKVLIDIANEGEIAQINQQLDGLATKLARANSISFDKNGAISANAGKSRQALTSLSLVAQDLPFGFIAIQNNLPAVISSFGALRASAVGTAGVMASLGAALAGPAGLFLAFSVVTGAVTFAVQKYGSLGAAIDALTGKYVDLGGVINRAAESLKEYNENQISTNEILASAEGSQAGQILKVKTLSAVVLDLSKSENVRKKALQELQELDETRFKNFSVEKGLLDGLSDSVKEYTRAIIAQAVAQKFTDQVSTTTVELEKQKNALSDISRQLYKYGNSQERLNKLAQEQSATARQGGIPRSANKEEREIQALVNKRKELQAGIDNLTTQLDEYNLSAQNAIETASSLASGLKKIGDSADDAAKGRKIDFKFDLKLSDDYKELTNYNSIDKSIDRLKQYADVVLDVNKSEKERSAALAKLSEDSLNVYNINEDLFNGFKIGKTPLKDISQAVDIYSFKLQELIVAEIKFQQSLKDSQRLTTGFGAAFKAQAKELTGANISDKIASLFNEEDFARIKDLAKDLPKTFIESFREFDGAFPSLDEFKNKLNEIIQLEFLKTGKLDLAQISELINAQLSKLKANVQTEIALNFDFDLLSKGAKLIEEQTEKIKNNITSAFSGVQNILQNTFFDLLDQGIANWKNFADEVIKEIKRIAAALLAKALVTGIANILAPGSGSAVSALLKGVDTESMGSWLDGMDSLGIPGAANFGGVRGADMAMSGQVVVALRGSDLVGAINRTNTSINRVG